MSAPKFKIGQLIKWKSKWHHMRLDTGVSGSSWSGAHSMSWDNNWSVGLILKEQRGDPNVWGFSLSINGSGSAYAIDDKPGFMVRDFKNKQNRFIELTNKSSYKVKIIK